MKLCLPFVFIFLFFPDCQSVQKWITSRILPATRKMREARSRRRSLDPLFDASRFIAKDTHRPWQANSSKGTWENDALVASSYPTYFPLVLASRFNQLLPDFDLFKMENNWPPSQQSSFSLFLSFSKTPSGRKTKAKHPKLFFF